MVTLEDQRPFRLSLLLSIAAFATLCSTALIVINPGLFWDDWLWVHQSPQDNLIIGRELGIWWAGYLSNFLASLPDPVLGVRLIALFGWIVASAAFGYTMFRRGLMTAFDATLVFILLCASHAALVRFTSSVAMYNFYIACFWIGCAILVRNPTSLRTQLASGALFFVSFHLNSLLSLYVLVLFAMFVGLPGRSSRRPITGPQAIATSPGASFRTDLFNFVRQNRVLIAVPIAFIVTIKLISFILVRTLGQTGVYSSYNRPSLSKAVATIIEAPMLLLSTAADYFLTAVNGLVFFPALLVIAILLLLSGPWKSDTSWRAIALQYLLSLMVFVFAMVPYFAAGKPPILSDFYEARHVLPALPAIAVLCVAIINTITLLLFGRSKWQHVGKMILVSSIVAYSIQASFTTGIGLLKDTVLQEAKKRFIQNNASFLSGNSTFVFDDRTNGFHLNNRRIWNYEYTGLLISVFHEKRYLGISSSEYQSWGPGESLLIEPRLRNRYNLANYDPKGDQVIISFQNSAVPLRLIEAVRMVGEMWTGKAPAAALKYFDFSISSPVLESRQVVGPLSAMAKRLHEMREKNEILPISDPSFGTPLETSSGLVPRGNLGAVTPAATTNLRQLPGAQNLPQCAEAGCGYLYFSDGIQFKLLLINPLDWDYVKQADAKLIDSRRRAYGYWSAGAAQW